MKITLIGDSLTAGNLGIPYEKYLKFADTILVRNHGLDGDTVVGVQSRLEDALREDGPDVLVIQVGANDFLLPEMASRGGAWTTFVDQMIARGSLPSSDAESFGESYANLIRTASSWGVGRIVCVTIPPTGEDLSSERNRIRRGFNLQIMRVAADAGAEIADVAGGFGDVLSGLDTSDWFFGEPEDFTADVRTVRRKRGSMSLAEERGLYLTMDGAHLNETGGALMAGIISKVILG